MSRIGKIPIDIPSNVDVKIHNGEILVKELLFQLKGSAMPINNIPAEQGSMNIDIEIK